jgi:hypothetical protein
MTQAQTSDAAEGRTDRYDAAAIEKKWQEQWERDGLYNVRHDDPRPKYFFLTMYPYPSGDLHTGHWYAETPPDTRPLPADEGLQRAVPLRLRRIRSAGRKRSDQEQHPSLQVDDGKH